MTLSVPLEEYLSTVYHPDCDYVGGHVEERNWGEFEHAELQTAMAVFLRQNAKTISGSYCC